MRASTALTVIKPQKPPANLKHLSGQLAKCKTPEAVLDFERRVSAYEAYMRKAGFSQGDLHETNEARMRARWRLGQMLAAADKAQGQRTDKATSSQAGKKLFAALLKRLKLDKNRAQEAQRIGTMPKIELEKLFQRHRQIGELLTIAELIDAARPYWYKASRQGKHRKIAAEAQNVEGEVGPFVLLYADPPWTFEIYSDKGLGRTAAQHYPTLTDDEIIDFQIGETSVSDMMFDDAVLLLWCTSSNFHRALKVVDGWGFEYKTHAVWDKVKPSLGLVFRNQHEILIYATKGNMPGPQWQPSSVFTYVRKRHSAKPAEIRQAIEKMYPDFDASTRCELFARSPIDGWTTYGLEAQPIREAAE